MEKMLLKIWRRAWNTVVWLHRQASQHWLGQISERELRNLWPEPRSWQRTSDNKHCSLHIKLIASKHMPEGLKSVPDDAKKRVYFTDLSMNSRIFGEF